MLGSGARNTQLVEHICEKELLTFQELGLQSRMVEPISGPRMGRELMGRCSQVEVWDGWNWDATRWVEMG